MKKSVTKILLTLMLMVVGITIANAQCLPPPPIIENVTVVPNTAGGDVIISWHENPANTCTTTGYEIYKYNYSTQIFDLLVLVPAGTTSYTEVNAGGNSRPQIYRMTTKAGALGNQHSENHHSMVLDPVFFYGPCEMYTTATWSPYETSYRDNFEVRLSEQTFNNAVKYQIEGYATTGTIFNPASAIPMSSITSDTIVSFIMIVNVDYLFRVKAFLPNGEISYSGVRHGNISGATIPRAPLFIHLDSLVSFDTHNHLHFTIDNATAMVKFQVERSQNANGPYEILTEFHDKTRTTYDDTSCDVNKEYFYRITAFNNIPYCNERPAIRSDTLNSIIVKLKYEKPDMSANWNSFILDTTYHIHRNNAFWFISPTRQFLDGNVQHDYMNNNIYDFCYTVSAFNRKGHVSISRENCINLDRPITMPSAIDPTSAYTNNLDTNRRRNEFAPLIGGDERLYEYHMIIFNRWNNVIFETTKPMDVPLTSDHFWHGTTATGGILPEDTYMYYVKITLKTSQKVYEKRGSVSIIYQ